MQEIPKGVLLAISIFLQKNLKEYLNNNFKNVSFNALTSN